jgi:hypothetical protein
MLVEARHHDAVDAATFELTELVAQRGDARRRGSSGCPWRLKAK